MEATTMATSSTGIRIREVVLASGQSCQVPQGIQRIDHRATHGWQLRYGRGTRLFSDGHAGGPAEALVLAVRELLNRIATEPAPSLLQKAPSRHKKNGLPAGVSGPVVRQRAHAAVRDCSFTVLLPRFGDRPQRRTVYIGTENTWTPEKYAAALARAVALREAAVQRYERAITAAKRRAARELRRLLRVAPT
jgi:hypothetical protein